MRRSSRHVFLLALFGLGAPPTVATVHAQDTSDTSLAALLAGRASVGDPDLETLDALLAELRGRPSAERDAAKPLQDAAQSIAHVRDLRAQRAEAPQIARGKQIAWAALSCADRVLARVQAQQALGEARRHLSSALRTPTQVASNVDGADSRLSIEKIRALAPDFLARAERALADAHKAGTAAERKDHERRAELLRAAAGEEADRIARVRQAADSEARATALDDANVRDENARAVLAAKQVEADAARSTQVALAAALVEAKAPITKGASAEARKVARALAARALLDRARTLRAAAVALSADESTLASAGKGIDASEALLTSGRDALPSALQALQSAEQAVAAAEKIAVRAAEP